MAEVENLWRLWWLKDFVKRGMGRRVGIVDFKAVVLSEGSL